jgi:hypothetical protein
LCGIRVAQRPTTSDDRVGTRCEERTREAQHALATLHDACCRLTRREHDDAASQVECLDLAGLQQPVFLRIARSEQDRRALGVRFIGNRMGREVEDIVRCHVRALEHVL